VTALTNSADCILRVVRVAVGERQRLLEAQRIGWPVACAGKRLGLELVERPLVVEHRGA
jgi:hypothetical protein